MTVQDFIYDRRTDSWLYGDHKFGIGIFLNDEFGEWYVKVVMYDHSQGIDYGFKDVEAAKLEAIQLYEYNLRQFEYKYEFYGKDFNRHA